MYLTKNDFQHSVGILEAAEKAVPEDFRVNFFLGVAYSRVGRNPDAARVLGMRTALFDRDRVVVAHPHRQLGTQGGAAGPQPLRDLPEPPERPTRLAR